MSNCAKIYNFLQDIFKEYVVRGDEEANESQILHNLMINSSVSVVQKQPQREIPSQSFIALPMEAAQMQKERLQGIKIFGETSVQ